MRNENRKPRPFRQTAARAVLYGTLCLGLVVVLFPFVWMVSTSLKDLTQIFQPRLRLIPEVIHWENWTRVWSELPFGRFYRNSVIVSVGVTVLQLATHSLAAYAFSRLQWRGRDKVFLLYLASLMIPGQVILIPNFLLIRMMGGIDTYWGVILPQVFTVFGVFLLRQFFLAIPASLEEAALMDGCGHLRIYLTIILPLCKGGLATLAVFAFLNSWNNFLWPLVVLYSDRMFTLPIGLLSFQGQFATNWPLLMAAAAQSMIPILVIYGVAQRQFVQGITMTGLANS